MPRTDDGSYHLPTVLRAKGIREGSVAWNAEMDRVSPSHAARPSVRYDIPMTCHGCGAPFCASGCEYCGRGSVAGKAHTEIAWSGQMVIDNPMRSIRTRQHSAPMEHLATALSGGRR